MLYLHKKSDRPIDPWPILRHGGLNNLDHPAVQGKYLVLFRVDIVHREGAWHYILEFDARNSLQTSALAQLAGQHQPYPDDMDWKTWLGPDYTPISAAVREEVLNMPQDDAHTDMVITGMRQLPHACPIPNRDGTNWNETEPPDEIVLSLM